MQPLAQVERAALCLRRFSGAQPGVRCVRRPLKRRRQKPQGRAFERLPFALRGTYFHQDTP